MVHTWRDNLKRLIDETPGLTMKAISLKAGLNPSAVHSILKKGHTPSVDGFVAIAQALGMSPVDLLDPGKVGAISIPLVGRASGGEMWTPIDEAIKAAASFELGTHDTIAIEVADNAMAPLYRAGDVLFCHRQFGSNADNLIGLDCVIRTADGRYYVKILQRGSRAGRFNLRSYTATEQDVEDVALAWVAPVRWIKRGPR